MPIPVPKNKPQTQLSLSWPPVLVRDDETEEERRLRLGEEAEAKRVSDNIDRQIETERQQKRKTAGPKILLLGQAESGKSTVLKNFQLHFAPKAFEIEAEVWRPVIHLNLVRSVNFIVNLVLSQSQGLRESLQNHQRRSSSVISPDLRKLCTRLAPLRQVEENLIKFLSGLEPPRSDDTGVQSQPYRPSKAPDISIPANNRWKQALSNQRVSTDSRSSTTRSGDRFGDSQSRRILAALGDDIAALWKDVTVQDILKSSDIALEEQPGFFLDQAVPVTREDFFPRPDDVLKARVTTIRPEQHTIIAEKGGEKAKHWTLYDVGGARGQRAVWAQFFDDVNIIIFLAPMSGFNQVLAEDESVNRLTDSLRLWQTICSNKLLAEVEFVLFLNKLDILDAKLKAGVQFSSFVTSYVDKPNETKPVAKYLLDVFVSLHQQYSPKRRKLHPHLTCAVDTKATSSIIIRIQETILVKILAETNII
ncbi:guanine nucleotide binding protein, alpha subunit [Gymnopilus junonius]|uniref:Guanine nucleotide binding protein, alpha subunit n=1 Tax=Gymnopilus junonius TaxID=109634 RepID=A0A9P5THN1_GYMJU|nr:guanine nucleotide binding protein, alpha subunit [Gymnopilus junonius]